MANLNKVFLMGNLTRNVDLKYIPSGTAIANFGIAINRSWEKDGEKKGEVCFVEITMFGRRAEVINEYFSKGSPIFIEGRLQFQQWEKNGERQHMLKVIAENFQFIGEAQKDKDSSLSQKEIRKDFGSQDVNEKDIPF